jgi:hypothetical protein
MRLFKSAFFTKSLNMSENMSENSIKQLRIVEHVNPLENVTIDNISKYCIENKVEYIMGREFDSTLKLYSSHERFIYNKIEPYVAFEMYIKHENKRMERFIQSNIGCIPKICLVLNPSGFRSVAVREACDYLKKNNIPYVII